MIRLTQTLILLLFVVGLQAQKVKLKDYKVKVQHVNLPTIGFASDVTTFDVTAEGNEDALARYGYTMANFSSKIKIGGYNKVDGGGSASVVLSVGAPIASPRELSTVDKVDKEKKKYKLYSYYYNLEVTCSYKVVDSKGNILSERAVPLKEKLSTSEYRSIAQLNKVYKEKYPQAKTNALKKLLNTCIGNINNQINREFSVGVINSKEQIVGLKSKSHPDLNKFKEIRTVVEDAFSKMTAESNDAFVAAIMPAIEFWAEKEPGYSTKDKHAKKLNYACRKNLALTYFWAEDFDNAIKYAKMIENGDHNEKKGKRLRERITKVKEGMEKLNMPTRHFAVRVSAEDEAKIQAHAEEMEAIYGAGDIKKFPNFDKKMKVQLESKVEPGKLFIKGGNVDDGYFVYEASESTPNFARPASIRFGKASDRSILVGNPKYASLDSMLIGDVMYRVGPVKYGEGLASIKLKNAIVEDVKGFNKSVLQIIHPPYAKGKMLGQEVELEAGYAIWHKGKQKHFSTDGLSFSKTMKKAFGECAPAMEYVNNMKAKNKKRKLLDKLAGSAYDTEDLYKILGLYDECK